MTASATTASWLVQEMPVPASLDDDDAWALHGVADLERVVQLDDWGYDDLAYPAAATLEGLRDQRYTARVPLIATHPDRPREVVGALFLRVPQVSNLHLTEGAVLVHPKHRRRGVGSALLAQAEVRTRELGRRLMILESDHGSEPAADDPDAMTPPTGAGRISRSDPFARFAARHGLTLEQTDRYSVLHLPVEPTLLAALEDEARRAAGPDYRVISWQGRCPDEWVDQFALLETRMSTDAPLGGLEIEEDPWDADRIRAAEATSAQSNRGSVVCAAVHVPTGTLAGFTELEFPLDAPEVVFQEDTLVLREHRGHRLGQLVKAVNLQRLAELRPQARRVHTWNAQENSYMLRINVALGFRPTGVCGAWQKVLG
jgi:GNAT superfamily N-acetyltransferase